MLYLEAQKKFLYSIETYCSKDTYIYYTNCFRVYSYFLFPRFNYEIYDVNDINDDLINEYIIYLRHLNIKNVSIRTYIRGLKSFYNWCYDKQICYYRIGKNIKLPRNDSEVKLPLTNEELEDIVDYINIKYDFITKKRNIAIVYLMASCGLRLQEVVNLTFSDVQPGYLVIRDSKCNKSRIVPLSSYGWCILNDYKSISELNRSFFSIHHDYFFCNNNCTPLSKTAVKQLFRKLKVVVPRVHPHLLRHTFATSYIMGGGSLEILRVLLGHSTYSVTQGYIARAAELSLVNYPIHILETIYFDSYNYNKKTERDAVPPLFAETSGIRTPDNLIKRKGV